MAYSNAEVTVNDLPTKSRLFRFCEKKIDQWLRTHQTVSNSETDAPVAFKVEFTEEDDTKQVSCVTEIQIGSHCYRGFDLANDEQQAFMHSLKRLHPTELSH